MIKADLGLLGMEVDLSTFLSVSISGRQSGTLIIQTELLDHKPLTDCAAFSPETARGILAAHRIQARNAGRAASTGMPSCTCPEQGTRPSETAGAARTTASPPRPHNDGIVRGIQPATLSLPFLQTQLQRRVRSGPKN